MLKDLVTGLLGNDGLKATAVSWKTSRKSQPPRTKFKVALTDAPNVNGARALGYAVGRGNEDTTDLSALRRAVEAGLVKALYVIDPGPDTLGDVAWIADARRKGLLPILIVQGVVATALTAAADIVLPGAAFAEKDAIYTNDQGCVQAASRAIAPPGEALEDWQILTSLGAALGLPFAYKSSAEVRTELAAALAGTPGYQELAGQVFNRPLPLKHWLQASNPMERWKWNVMFQDLPPIKGHNVQMESAPQPSAIPLRLVTEQVPRASD